MFFFPSWILTAVTDLTAAAESQSIAVLCPLFLVQYRACTGELSRDLFQEGGEDTCILPHVTIHRLWPLVLWPIESIGFPQNHSEPRSELGC